MTKPLQQLAVSSGQRRCADCVSVLPLSSFSTYPYQGRRYYRSYCKPCFKARDQRRERLSYSDFSAEEKKRHCDNTMRFRQKRRALGCCAACNKAIPERGAICKVCRKERSENRKLEHKKLRQVILDHYGHYCSCCPPERTNSDEFLTIEHVGGWGKDHRYKSGARIEGTALLRWIIRNGFPDSIAIHCYNCNCSKGHHGYCPHELERSASDTITSNLTQPALADCESIRKEK